MQKKLPLLKQGQQTCPVCQKLLVKKLGKITVYDDGNTPIDAITHHLQFCSSDKCNVYFAYGSDMKELRRIAAPYHIEFIDKTYSHAYAFLADVFSCPKPIKKEYGMTSPNFQQGQEIKDNPLPPEDIQSKQEDNTGLLIIYKNKCHCLLCEHRFGKSSIENRAMYIDCIWGEDILVHVQFCRTCGMYYMSDVALRLTEMNYGRIFIEREFDDFDWASFKGELNPESLLHRFGYNANENSRENERHAILKHLLDTGRFEKYEIINHLSFLISMNGNRCYKAKPKWETDIQFVTDYRLSEQKIVFGLTPKKKHKA